MVQGVRMPAAHELEPLEVRFPKFDLPLLQFLKARPLLCAHTIRHSARTLAYVPSTPYVR